MARGPDPLLVVLLGCALLAGGSGVLRTFLHRDSGQLRWYRTPVTLSRQTPCRSLAHIPLA